MPLLQSTVASVAGSAPQGSWAPPRGGVSEGPSTSIMNTGPKPHINHSLSIYLSIYLYIYISISIYIYIYLYLYIYR